jgi:predicted RNase H-like HicB family nuclease
MTALTAIIEKCPDTNLYVGYVPGVPGAHTQAETLEELNENLKEVIELLFEAGDFKIESNFFGTQTIIIPQNVKYPGIKAS